MFFLIAALAVVTVTFAALSTIESTVPQQVSDGESGESGSEQDEREQKNGRRDRKKKEAKPKKKTTKKVANTVSMAPIPVPEKSKNQNRGKNASSGLSSISAQVKGPTAGRSSRSSGRR